MGIRFSSTLDTKEEKKKYDNVTGPTHYLDWEIEKKRSEKES